MDYGALPDPLEASPSSFSIFKSSPPKRETPLDTPYHLHRSSPTSVIFYQEGRNEVSQVDIKTHECITYNLSSPVTAASASSPDIILAALQSEELATLSATSSSTATPTPTPELLGLRVASSTHPPAHLSHDPSCRLLTSPNIIYGTSLSTSPEDIFVTPIASPSPIIATAFEGGLLVNLRSSAPGESTLQVVDTERHASRTIPLSGEATDVSFLDESHVAVLLSSGTVRVLEVGDTLEDSLSSHREMLGLPPSAVPDGEGMSSLTREGQPEGESWRPPSLDDPKFGEWDDKNEAHVGGSNWAGGTGGSNTAGLGGRGADPTGSTEGTRSTRSQTAPRPRSPRSRRGWPGRWPRRHLKTSSRR